MTKPLARPRPLALVFVLGLVALAAAAIFVMTLAISQGTTDAGGTMREVSLAERLANDPGRAFGSLAMSVAAALGAMGFWMRRSWAAYPASAVGAGTLLVGGFLLYQAAREWGMEGSFSPLLVPPGLVCVGVGAYVLITAVRRLS